MKKLLKLIGTVLLAVVVAAAALIGYLTVREYRPAETEPAQIPANTANTVPFAGDTVRVLTFNTGYAALGDNADFFMDGGKGVMTADEARVRKNMADITEAIRAAGADFTMLQETDLDSSRSFRINQMEDYRAALGGSYAYALNYRCDFVPFPLPPIGKVTSGLQTLTPYTITEAERRALPCPFSWPIRVANLKRCLLVTRTPVEGSDRELVLVNLHLEAYDDGEGKIAQTKALYSFLQTEYEKGNYVIVGGDFNQSFPGSRERYPMDPAYWIPGTLTEELPGEGWTLAYDLDAPTCRVLSEPYDHESASYCVIDGFLLSPNLSLVSVETQNLDFYAADHNPVLVEALLG